MKGAVECRRGAACAEDGRDMTERRRETVHAPELDGALAWLNVDRPLSLAELRGCVVILDFWTYCCINCLHVLPDLEFLEQKFAGENAIVFMGPLP